MATALETYLLQLVNQERAKVGAPALIFDAELSKAAQGHTDWMDSTNTLSHTGAGGSSPFERAKAAGYDYTSAAENVAYASDRGAAGLDKADIDTLHTNLMNSPGHKSNILNPSMKEIGLGLSMDDGRAYVTELFGVPTKAEAAEGDKGGGSAPPAPAPVPVPAPKPPVPEIKGVVKQGSSKSDFLKGSAGDDILIGGKGHDILVGGKGADTFAFKSVRDGIDKVLDFQVGQDKIDVSAIKGHFEIEQHTTKGGTLIEIDMSGPGPDVGMVFLAGVTSELADSHFIH